MRKKTPLITLLAGPSGVGKDAALAELRRRDPGRHFPVTVTTRPIRPGEEQGREYHFIDRRTFQETWLEGEFLETALVHGSWYGTPRNEIETPLCHGMDVILKIDVQGARQVRKIYPQAVGIFMLPESMDQLRQRLEQRQDRDIEARLETAGREIALAQEFDHQVTNLEGRLLDTVDAIEAIIEMTKTRANPNP